MKNILVLISLLLVLGNGLVSAQDTAKSPQPRRPVQVADTARQGPEWGQKRGTPQGQRR